MAGEVLMMRGSRQAGLDEIAEMRPPEPKGRWFPVAHSDVVMETKEILTGAGFKVSQESYAVSRSNNRFFGVLTLGSAIGDETMLMVGVRNSYDKSFPIGFCAGSHCLVCDNLSFVSDVVVAKKHTRHGAERFSEGIQLAVSTLNLFQQSESERIRYLEQKEVPETLAEALILRAYEQDVITIRQVGPVLERWRSLAIPQFSKRSFWTLQNAFTRPMSAPEVSGDPFQYSRRSMRLNGLLMGAALAV
jgi:hypothetical protein